MRSFAFVAIILLAAIAFAAETYTSEYNAGDWLKVTRTTILAQEPLCLDSYGVTDACANMGGIQPNQGTSSSKDTGVELLLENVGPVDRTGIDLTEDLSYVPAGAKVAFSPSPSSTNGRSATWSLGKLARGASLKISYTIGAAVSSASLSAIPDIAVSAEPSPISLSAPESVNAGEKTTLTVADSAGKPIPNAIVVVTYPDGVKHPLRSDLYGTVKFTAADEGTYTYSLEGYSIPNEVSTEAGPAAPAVPEAPVAAMQDSSLAGSIMGVLPVLAAVFAIAVIALMLYNFFTSRRSEDEEYLPSNVPSSASEPGMAYTQKFSFGSSEPQEAGVRDRTHDLVESRKRRMAETAAAIGSTGETADAETEAGTESTASGEDMESILSELEHKARKGGEVATEEEEAEVEKTISELEAIREKLRAMRAKGKGAALEGADDADSEEEEGAEAGESETPEEEPEAEEAETAEEETDDSADETEEEEETPVKKTVPFRPYPKKIVYEKRAEPKVSPKPAKKGLKSRFGNRGVKGKR